MPLLSSVTNRYVAEAEEIRANLVAQMIEPVRYMQLVQRLVQERATVFVEVGPQQVLSRLTRQVINGTKNIVLAATDHPKRVRRNAAARAGGARSGGGEYVVDGRSRRRCNAKVGEPYELFHDRSFRCHGAAPKRRRGGHTVSPPAPATEKLQAVEQFDATAARREVRRGGAPSLPARAAETTTAPVAVRSDVERVATKVGSLPIAPAAALTTADKATQPTLQLERFLVDFVVEQTGYPAEMIDLDWDMEADLGIDSIKRAQLFGELREFFDLESPGREGSGKGGLVARSIPYLAASARFSAPGSWQGNVARHSIDTNSFESAVAVSPPSLSTLVATSVRAPQPALATESLPERIETSAASGQLAVHVRGPTAPAAAIAVAPMNPAAIRNLEKFLVDFVVEQTGYPAEIVELDADLEADLGIDSIKKAQLFGELREHFTLPH